MTSPFLDKLWKIVNDAANEDIIRWDAGGWSFRIVSQTRLQIEVLGQHFNHSNFASFKRQLSYYQFERVVMDDGYHYFNKHFVRGNEAYLSRITRRLSEKRGAPTRHSQDLAALMAEFARCDQDTLTKEMLLERNNQLQRDNAGLIAQVQTILQCMTAEHARQAESADVPPQQQQREERLW